MRLPFLKGSYSALDCLFLIVWVRFTLLDYVRIVVMHLPVINSLSNFVIPIVMVTFILLSLKSFAERLSLSDVFFYVIVVCLYLMTYAFYPENTKYLDEMSFQFLMCSLPYFFVGRIIDYEKIAKPLYILSVISIICITLLYFLGNAEEREEVSGMHRAYQMLPYVCVVFCRVFKNKDIISIIIAFLSIFVLLSFGNRGSVLYLFVFIIPGIIPSMKSKHKFFIILAISFIMVLFYMYFDFIVLGLHGIMEQFGFSVRIFEKIIEGEITDSSGRDVIVNKLFSELNANPWGLGLLGDRVVTGIYAHNFFIEIIVSYGYFVGSMICMLLLICIVKALRTNRHTNSSLFYMSMVCFGFLPLMTSHSFLTYPNFWLFVGYTISILSTKKSKSINSI